MSTSFNIGYVFLIYILAVTINEGRSSDEVVLSASPTEIVEGLTTDLQLQCSFTRQRITSLASVMSIYISHSVAAEKPVFNYVASVNIVEGHAHNISHEVSEISGSVENNGNSFLSVRIVKPTYDSAGVYKCDVIGFDVDGKPVELTNVTTVTADQLDVNTLNRELDRLESGIQDQDTFMRMFMRRVNNMIEMMFHGPVNYSGHQYYLTKKLDHFVYPEAQAVCEFYGGYLLEVNSPGEFTFIRDWILRMKSNVSDTVWTGATDEEQEGVWINKHDNNNTSGSHFEWGSGRPLTDKTDNCQCYHQSVSWYLSDCYCSYRSTDRVYNAGYICEIPNLLN